MATQLECFTCGGSYTADQRRRHETTVKHQNAVIGKAMAGQKAAKGDKVRSPKDTRPVPPPEVIEAHVAALAAEEPQTSEEPTSPVTATKAQPVKFPGAATAIEALEKAVKARAADVRWTEKHDADKPEILEKRRARLAEAEAALAAAKA